MDITVAGTGYVGLVVGTCLAYLGHRVVCYDTDEAKIKRLQDGEVPIYEPGLKDLIAQVEGNLQFEDTPESIGRADIIVIAVGTPPREDGSSDLRAIDAVARMIGRHAKKPFLAIIKSTVPVGTSEQVRFIISSHTQVPFDVVSNPEFLREGNAVEDFLNPARVVVGFKKLSSKDSMEQLYAKFVEKVPFFYMNNKSAELTKYTANAMLAVKISFINEIAALCERVGADVDSVSKAVGADPRIGHDGLRPGVGYGGSCFPKDVASLLTTSQEKGLSLKIISAAQEVNHHQKSLMVRKVVDRFPTRMKGLNVYVWGLSFKPGTDDVREAPALVVIQELLALGAVISVYDPQAMESAREVLGDSVHYLPNKERGMADASALILMTEWPEFKDPDWRLMDEAAGRFSIFDGRNLWNPEEVRGHGFEYYGIGRR